MIQYHQLLLKKTFHIEDVDYKVEKVVVKFDPEISGDENKKNIKLKINKKTF